MKNIPLLTGTLVGTLVLIAGVVFLFSRNQVGAGQAVETQILVSEQPHVRGIQTAAVKIVEFSDFQCPACQAYQPLITQLLTAYPDDVQLIYRHLPLSSIHPWAELGARASEVAAEEDKFWEYHDLLFERQDEWAATTNQATVLETLANYAEELGIDKDNFLERIESDHIKTEVAVDLSVADQLRIQATPTFFVNGQPTPATQLKSVVESTINSQGQ